ncbi:MAG: type II toxin-antitoxin system RelE/ParE family toxin [Aestuariivirga sp.]|nr:type II toxin-antitoxin system RelE/ParE family toxin [Aestuariivirga sp.]
MIRSFAGRDTELVWQGIRSRRLPDDVQRAGLRKLLYLNRAKVIGDLREPPGNRLEQLRGTRAGQWSIRINDQWRICFRWEDGDAKDVEIIDYR